MIKQRKRGFEKKKVITIIFALVLLMAILNMIFFFNSFSPNQSSKQIVSVQKNAAETQESAENRIILNPTPLSQKTQNQTADKTSPVRRKSSGGGGSGGSSNSPPPTPSTNDNTDDTGNNDQNDNPPADDNDDSNDSQDNSSDTEGDGRTMTFQFGTGLG